ncbi:hypothetical protein TPAR_03459 [Tolypocladium paradoxum]|uniref:Aminoglycoside phosphotransferase domain-containing protein n=1 Tax=Tolypocladium paradoxum TaxID=94208 RepID=A0A2S4L1N2_9HYPO|nr:hypothetical protein TPAR_03459 [Tolypocladium paradoxum]
MERTLPLLKGRVSLGEALKEDVDIIRELAYPEKRLQFWLHLYSCRRQIAEVVSRHLNILESDFSLGEVEEWIHGSYNACIPIHIAERARGSRLPPQAIVRFPLPYKVGEDFYPGNVDEKLRCEAATYVWLQQNCPDIPVPRLFGFGFPAGQSFTAVENESFCSRILWFVRRAIPWMFGRTLPPYVPHNRCHLLDLGYLVIERIDSGRMLSESWEEHRHDPNRRANLFRGLSRIMLRLSKLPLPRIGSWTLDDRGVLKLTNRPLTLLLHQLENAEIPTDIPRDRTYTSVEPYFLDLIACQDNRMRYQPNSIHNQGDGETQLAALTAMRAVLPKFTDRQFRDGPFVYSLTDLHQSNIFVDDDWHITSIIDLEWACARPIEMLGPPDWLSGRSLEEIAFHLDEYASVHDEFVDAFEREELAQCQSNANAEAMRACWKTGSFWYSHALDSPTVLLALFVDHIQPRFAKLSSTSWDEFSRMLMRLWDLDSQRFISSKVIEQGQYVNQLRKMFTSSFDGQGRD